jgi:hypothetical protein
MVNKIENMPWVVIDEWGKIYRYKNQKQALKHKNATRTMTEQYFIDHYKQNFLSF